MFNIRRHRSARQPTQRLSTVALIIAGLVTALATPTQARTLDEGGSEASSSGPQISALVFNTGGAKPASASNCTVRGYDGDGWYLIIATSYGPDSDEPDKVIEGVLDQSEEESEYKREETNSADDDYAVPSPQLTNPDEDRPEGDERDTDSFLTELEEGKFDVDGDQWGVWRVYCGEDQKEESEDFSIVSAPLSPAGLIAPALDFVQEYLPEPDLTLQPFDEEHGWTYVQAPIDFRTPADTLLPITITADTGGPEQIRQWITITATPNTVIYNSGDTKTETTQTECPAAAADPTQNPYIAETPGACSYTYRNGSSITDNNVFEAELSITWTVESIDKNGVQRTLTVEPTTQQQDVAVAEVKAVNVYDQ